MFMQYSRLQSAFERQKNGRAPFEIKQFKLFLHLDVASLLLLHRK